MKKLVLVLLLMTGLVSVRAQNNAVNVFSQDGDPFFLIINGVKRNSEPRTSVRADELKKDIMYKLKVVFADGVTPDADKKIFYEENNKLMSLAIIKKMKNGSVKKVKLRYNGLTDIENTASTTATDGASSSGSSVDHSGGTTHTTTSEGGGSSSTSTTTTTSSGTTTVSSSGSADGNSGSGHVSTGVNETNGDGEVTITVSVDASGSGSSTESTETTTTQSTTTTTTSGSSGTSTGDNSQQYDMTGTVPGYTGAVGCYGTVADTDEVTEAIESESFSSDKMTILKQATNDLCVTTDQVLSFMQAFSFESDQLEVAKMLYDQTYDKENYYKVTNAFTFSSSKDELNEYIENQ